MFKRPNPDRVAKNLNAGVRETNRRGTQAPTDPTSAATNVNQNLSRSVRKAAKRGKGTN